MLVVPVGIFRLILICSYERGWEADLYIELTVGEAISPSFDLVSTLDFDF